MEKRDMDKNVNWKKMYIKMASAVADAIELIENSQPNQAAMRLIAGQLECEEIYIDAGEENNKGNIIKFTKYNYVN